MLPQTIVRALVKKSLWQNISLWRRTCNQETDQLAERIWCESIHIPAVPGLRSLSVGKRKLNIDTTDLIIKWQWTWIGHSENEAESKSLRPIQLTLAALALLFGLYCIKALYSFSYQIWTGSNWISPLSYWQCVKCEYLPAASADCFSSHGCSRCP